MTYWNYYPQAWIRTRISLGSGTGIETSCTEIRLLWVSIIAAFIVLDFIMAKRTLNTKILIMVYTFHADLGYGILINNSKICLNELIKVIIDDTSK